MSAKQVLLGVDVGTTAAKAAAFDERGEVLAVGRSAYPVDYPQPGWAEQDPEELWQGVVTAIRASIQHLPPNHTVAAMGISSQGATTILLGERDRPLRPAVSWMDMRAKALVPGIESALDRESIYQAIGWPFDAWMPMAHLAWLRRNDPKSWAQMRRVGFVDAYIKLRLCGSLATDPTLAGATGLYDVVNGDWHPRHLEYVGLSPVQLPSVAPSTSIIGTSTPEVTELLGLSKPIPVINGAHDQICSVTAAGVAQPCEALIGTGTAWGVIGAVSQPVYDLSHFLTLEPHTIPGLWCPMRTQGGVGGAVGWLAESLLTGLASSVDRTTLYDDLDKKIQGSPAGARGLVFLAPDRRHGANGNLHGLTLSHTAGDVGRALMEGIVCELRIMAAEMRNAGVCLESLTMTGGATTSTVWPTIVADMLGLSIRIPEMAEAGSRGGAILAGVGCGLYDDVPSGIAAFDLPARMIRPNLENRSVYEDLVARYSAIDHCFEQECAS